MQSAIIKGALGLALGLALANPATAGPATKKAAPSEAEFFEKAIRPILADNCWRCHGPDKQKADLRLDSRAAMLEGGESGPVIVPGNPDRSVLIQAIRYSTTVKMPPKQKLPVRAVQALTAWVKMGAPWPHDQKTVTHSSPAEARKKHWAFQPVQRPAIPAVQNAGLALTPVDAFILAKLDANHLTLAPAADRRTLIRRATFDLIGLPPTAAEIAAFEADRSPEAFARLLDRLLASPHYGERWGRHWLDVARYADTKGYVFTQERRFAYAYTYRDYVIRALNHDLPYDQFITDQLAADLLPPAADNRRLAAMGFLTVGRRFLNNPHDIIDDRIDVVTRGFLGLTVTCARCHDHKFDPIPTKDYYSLYGVFASSFEPPELPLLATPKNSPGYLAFKKELDTRQGRLNAYVAQTHADLLERLRAQVPEYLLAAQSLPGQLDQKSRQILVGQGLSPLVVRRWQHVLAETRKQHNFILGPWHAFAALDARVFAAQAPALAAQLTANADPRRPIHPLVAQAFGGKPPTSLADVARRYGELFDKADRLWKEAVQQAARRGQPMPTALPDKNQEALRQVLYSPASPINIPAAELPRYVNRAVRERITDLGRQVDAWKSTSPDAPPRAMVMRDLPRPVTPHVLLRGNPNNVGPEVPRQFLGILAGDHRKPFPTGSGRLELAQAIADRNNPLTARVMVNRIWLHHFGAGLVRTPSDFGLRSDPPTHPQLLDYLAGRFMDEGWSIKAMHRLIMLSRVYQQASEGDPHARQVDVDNRLLARMSRRRLDFEAMRDAFLAVSGKLEPALGGRSVDITEAPFTGRRTVYGFVDRQNLPGLFRTFDFASPDTSNPQRFTTTVPQQALFLLNSPFLVEQARLLVGRAEFATLKEPAQRIQYLHHRAYGRSADGDEVALGLQFVQAAQPPLRPARPRRRRGVVYPVLTAWEKYAQVLLLANEFVFVD